MSGSQPSCQAASRHMGVSRHGPPRNAPRWKEAGQAEGCPERDPLAHLASVGLVTSCGFLAMKKDITRPSSPGSSFRGVNMTTASKPPPPPPPQKKKETPPESHLSHCAETAVLVHLHLQALESSAELAGLQEVRRVGGVLAASAHMRFEGLTLIP